MILNFKLLADKREKFSIRKYKSIGAASAVVGILFLAGGRVHAAENVAADSSDKHRNETVDLNAEANKLMTTELKSKVSEIAVTETETKPAETASKDNVSANKDQPSDKFKMVLRRASDSDSADTESVEFKPANSRDTSDSSTITDSTVERSSDTDASRSTSSRRGKREVSVDNRVLSAYVNRSNKKDIPVSGLESVDSIDYTTNPNPSATNEGFIYNNLIAKLEKIDSASSNHQRYRLTLKDGEVMPENGKIVLSGAAFGYPISYTLVMGTETVGYVGVTDHNVPNNLTKKLKDTTKIDDYIRIFENLDSYDIPLKSLEFTFNKNFTKYDRNRVVEFTLPKTADNQLDSSLTVRETMTGFLDSAGVSHGLRKKVTPYLLNPYDAGRVMMLDKSNIYVSKSTLKSNDTLSKNAITTMTFNDAVNRPFYFDSAYVSVAKLAVLDGDPSNPEPVLKIGDTLATILSENSLFTTTDEYKIGDVVSLDITDTPKNRPIVTGNRFTDSDKYVITSTSADNAPLRSKARFELIEKTDRVYKWKLLDNISVVNADISIPTEKLAPMALRSDWLERFGVENFKRYIASNIRDAQSFAQTNSLSVNLIFNMNGKEISKTATSQIEKNVNSLFGDTSTGTVNVIHKTDTGTILKEKSAIVTDQPWYTAVNIDPQHFEGYQFKSSTEILSTIAGKGERTIELIYTKPKEVVKKDPIKVTYVVDETKDGGYRNEVVGTPTVTTTRTDYVYSPETRTATPKDTVTTVEGTPTVVTLGTKPTTEVTYQDFNTRYVADPNRTAGEKFTETEGFRGTTTITTTYSANTETGVVTSTKGQPQVVVPTDKVVKVGTKSTTQTTVISKDTIYQADPDSAYESRTTVTAGHDGSTTTTTTYTLNEQNGEVTPNTQTNTVEKEDTVIKIGNVRTETETLQKTTHYEADSDIEFEKKELQVEGRDGQITAKYTYTVSSTDGSLSDPVRSVDERDVGGMMPDIYHVGNKKQDRRETAITTRYEADPEKIRDEKETVSQGVLGVHTTTTVYKVNDETGALSGPVVSETDVPMEPKVVKIGTKPTVNVETIAITTKYIFDENLTHGRQIVEEKGSEGRIVTTTTYTMNESDGTTTADTPDVQTVPMVQQVIRIGVKPTVEETPINFNTLYEPDSTADKDSRADKVAGKVGKVTTTTTYSYDNTTGVVTPNKPTTVTEEAIDRIVKVGARPNVVETPIDFTTTYEADPESQRDSKTDKIVGKKGTTTVTTTYSVDPKTGVVTENPSTTAVKDPTNAVIKVGTKSTEVVETLPSPVRFVKDPTRPKDEEPLTEQGGTGSKTTVTTYTVNPKTGVTTPNEQLPVVVEPTDTIVKVPAGDKVVETPVEPTVVYEKDETRDEGTPNETIPGEKGKTVTTTTYDVNPKDGTVTEKVGEPVVTPAGVTKVKVGAKTKVELIKDGGKTIQRMTSYDVDPNTGKVTPHVNDQVIGYSGDVTPPVVEIPEYSDGVTPSDALINEIPEYTDPIGGNGLDGEGNTIAPPTFEIPEYAGTVNSNDSDVEGNTITPPAVEIPEYAGPIGMNPDDAPVHELPELEIPDEPASPVDPIAPILPHVTDRRRTDEVPSTTHQNDVPSIETPANEQNTGSNDQTYVDKSTTAQLPNTGTASSSSMLAAGLASAMSAVGLMFAGFRRKKDN